MRILDARFKYTPSTNTNIVATWKRHGYKPTTEAERTARQRRELGKTVGDSYSASVTPLDSAKRRQQPALRAAAAKVAGGGEQSS
jgi:hypothetical protein